VPTATVAYRLARALRHAPDRLLHPWRRRRARARLAALRPDSLLFVCHGNICRSPFAAAAARRLLPGLAARITSAGFIGPDRPAPAEALQAAASLGLDLASHRSRLLDTRTARSAGLVVVMDGAQARGVRSLGVAPARVLQLGDLDPEPIERRTIADPVEQPLEVFLACYRRIDRCVGALAAAITAPSA